ncbi:hypothetical protein DK37_20005 [Halomonas sp. SUBG004]|nr:hypothetical protein DK37_20005 [Halomonas sp. SUBG004]
MADIGSRKLRQRKPLAQPRSIVLFLLRFAFTLGTRHLFQFLFAHRVVHLFRGVIQLAGLGLAAFGGKGGASGFFAGLSTWLSFNDSCQLTSMRWARY